MTQTRAHSDYGYTSFVKKNMLVFAKCHTYMPRWYTL